MTTPTGVTSTSAGPSIPEIRPDAEEIAELIADCSEIPRALRTGHHALPLPRTAAPWTVNDTCLAAVDELDEYV